MEVISLDEKNLLRQENRYHCHVGTLNKKLQQAAQLSIESEPSSHLTRSKKVNTCALHLPYLKISTIFGTARTFKGSKRPHLHLRTDLNKFHASSSNVKMPSIFLSTAFTGTLQLLFSTLADSHSAFRSQWQHFPSLIHSLLLLLVVVFQSCTPRSRVVFYFLAVS